MGGALPRPGFRVRGRQIVVERGSGTLWGWTFLLGVLTVPGLFVLLVALRTLPSYGIGPILLGIALTAPPAFGVLRVAYRPAGRPFLILDDEGIQRVGGRRLRWDQLKRVHGWPRTKGGRLTLLRLEPRRDAGRAWTIPRESIAVSRGMLVGMIAAHGVPVSVELAADLRPDDPYELWRVDPAKAVGAPPPKNLAAAIGQLLDDRTSVVLVGETNWSSYPYVTLTRGDGAIVAEVPGPQALRGPDEIIELTTDRLHAAGWDIADEAAIALRRTVAPNERALEEVVTDAIVALGIREPWVATDAMRPRVEIREPDLGETAVAAGRTVAGWMLTFWVLFVIIGLPGGALAFVGGEGPGALILWAIAAGGLIFAGRRGWIPAP